MTEADPFPPPPNLPGIHELLAVIARLRNPGGCPWDRAQTMASMAPHLVEEAFEAADALRRGVVEEAQEELGDVLVNVAMISQMAREQGAFDVDAVAAAAAQKLVRRHPHVFGDPTTERAKGGVDGAEQAYRSWEAKKREERSEGRSVLAGVPVALPALLRAFRLGEKAARAGFDWPDREGPRAKVTEELAELDAAIASRDDTAIAAELGDLLFSLCNLARHLSQNPEVARASAPHPVQPPF
jgi:MazG family protein